MYICFIVLCACCDVFALLLLGTSGRRKHAEGLQEKTLLLRQSQKGTVSELASKHQC